MSENGEKLTSGSVSEIQALNKMKTLGSLQY